MNHRGDLAALAPAPDVHASDVVDGSGLLDPLEERLTRPSARGSVSMSVLLRSEGIRRWQRPVGPSAVGAVLVSRSGRPRPCRRRGIDPTPPRAASRLRSVATARGRMSPRTESFHSSTGGIRSVFAGVRTLRRLGRLADAASGAWVAAVVLRLKRGEGCPMRAGTPEKTEYGARIRGRVTTLYLRAGGPARLHGRRLARPPRRGRPSCRAMRRRSTGSRCSRSARGSSATSGP